MISNTSFVFPQSHNTSILTMESFIEHPNGTPSKRLSLLHKRWMDSITTIITHTFFSLVPISVDFSQAPTSNHWFSKIIRMYSSQDRYYHTVCHLEEMFAYIDNCVNSYCCRVPKKEMSIVNMAVFFHDVIYNPKSSTNEEDSIECFQQFYRDLFTDSYILETTKSCHGDENHNDSVEKNAPKWNGYDQVIRFILATKSHTVSKLNEDGENPFFLNLFLDADMSVLGKEEKAYNYYSSLIRKEYDFVPHTEYCDKRALILGSFLSQPIFKTDVMKDALESRAQLNLRREIESLQKGIIPRPA